MISSLRGKVARVFGGYIEVEVGGVGYEVQFSIKNYELRIGEEIKLFIYTSMNDSSISLFGFKTVEELDLFKMLITVSGVGPRTAMGIVGEKSSLDIIKAIGEADVDFFKKLKGIGLKTAQRIIVDLKSKIGGLGELDLRDNLPLIEDDLVLSLQQLGFEKKEIESVIKKLPAELVELEEKLSWCLLNMK
jgi:Holliday junction DNA helicase RuvA